MKAIPRCALLSDPTSSEGFRAFDGIAPGSAVSHSMVPRVRHDYCHPFACTEDADTSTDRTTFKPVHLDGHDNKMYAMETFPGGREWRALSSLVADPSCERDL